MKPTENQDCKENVPVADVGSTALLGTMCFEMPKYVSVSYEPREDITAYELAKLVPLFLNKLPITESTLAELGSAARHLTRHA